MLSKANDAVEVDYSKQIKSLDSLIKKYDDAVKRIGNLERAINSLSKSMDSLSGVSEIENLNSKLKETTDTANVLKNSIFGIFTPFSSEINGTSGSMNAFIGGIGSILTSYDTLNGGNMLVLSNLFSLAGVLALITGSFLLVSESAQNLDADMVSNITAVFNSLSSVISSIIPLFETFKNSGISLGDAAGLLGIVLGELFLAFFLITGVAKLLGTSGLDSIGELFTGIGAAITPLASLFEGFKNSGLSLIDAASLLGIVLGELGLFLLAITKIIKGIDTESILVICLVLTSLATVLLGVALMFDALKDSGLNVGEAILLLTVIFGGILAFLKVLMVLAEQLVNNPKLLIGLLALVAAISVVMLVLAETLPTILDALGKFINAIAPVIIAVLTTIGGIIVDIIYTLGTVLPPIIETVGGVFNTIFKGVAKIIDSVGNVILNILNTLKDLVPTVLKSILNFINELGPAINNFVDNAIQAVTKLINFLISGIEYLINTLIIGSINGLIEKASGVTEIIGKKLPTIPKVKLERFVPRLATGAVIPPRHEFLAVLGDQKHGTNIEAPLETIKQANREVMKEFGGSNKEIVLKNLTIVTQFGNKEFKKMVLDSIRLSEKEIGKPLLVS